MQKSSDLKAFKNFASQIPKMPKMPLAVFETLFKMATLVTVEMAIADGKGGYLLTMRNDKNFSGWHFPGGFLGYKESFNGALQRIAKRELGIAVQDVRFIGPINYNHQEDPRGHVVSLLFSGKANRKPLDGQYFERPPKQFAPHVPIIFKLLKGHGK